MLFRSVGIATAGLMNGFAWVEEGLDFVTETELFATSPTGRGAAARSRSAMWRR